MVAIITTVIITVYSTLIGVCLKDEAFAGMHEGFDAGHSRASGRENTSSSCYILSSGWRLLGTILNQIFRESAHREKRSPRFFLLVLKDPGRPFMFEGWFCFFSPWMWRLILFTKRALPVPWPVKFDLLAFSRKHRRCTQRTAHSWKASASFRFWLSDPSGPSVWDR